jgi:hypothetical protein
MKKFVNNYQVNLETLYELFDSLTSWDKGKFLEKHLNFLEFGEYPQKYVKKFITKQDVLEYLENHPVDYNEIVAQYNQ